MFVKIFPYRDSHLMFYFPNGLRVRTTYSNSQIPFRNMKIESFNFDTLAGMRSYVMNLSNSATTKIFEGHSENFLLISSFNFLVI